MGPAKADEDQALDAFYRFNRTPGALVAVISLLDGAGQPYPIIPRGTGGFKICVPGLPSRCLKDPGSILYVAVPRALRDKILTEGYRPARRSCIPTATSRDAAGRAYRRNFRFSPYEVIATLPAASMPRYEHKGGWKLRVPLLPGELL